MGIGWHRLDHIGIIVKDMDKAMGFYSKVFGFELPKIGPYKKIIEVGPGRKYCLISSSGEVEGESFIEFLALAQDEGSKWLIDMGMMDGTICEVCIAVDNIEEWYDRVKGMGYTPVNGPSAKPLVNKKYVESPSGSRWFYLLPSETGQQYWVEILERPGDPYRKR